MGKERVQTFENHARYVPLYHIVLAAIVVIDVGWSVTRLVRHPSVDGAVALLTALGLMIVFFYMRQFALTVQDRVIRLEMRLRLAKVLPADLVPRTGELAVGQLIALRFASDGELPELVRTVLAQGITDRTAIKKLVREWQPDTLRV
ncbi:MAG TPA: DUF6526 family protein [Thermoanaerobaculaceae bacterium]|nr:DUF6526 family protein [Thermoanaerobaculaceae bacterium]